MSNFLLYSGVSTFPVRLADVGNLYDLSVRGGLEDVQGVVAARGDAVELSSVRTVTLNMAARTEWELWWKLDQLSEFVKKANLLQRLGKPIFWGIAPGAVLSFKPQPVLKSPTHYTVSLSFATTYPRPCRVMPLSGALYQANRYGALPPSSGKLVLKNYATNGILALKLHAQEGFRSYSRAALPVQSPKSSKVFLLGSPRATPDAATVEYRQQGDEATLLERAYGVLDFLKNAGEVGRQLEQYVPLMHLPGDGHSVASLELRPWNPQNWLARYALRPMRLPRIAAPPLSDIPPEPTTPQYVIRAPDGAAIIAPDGAYIVWRT